MHHRNRAAPIALARNAPVAQAVVGHTPADAARFALRNGAGNARLARLHRLAREPAHIAHTLGFQRHIGLGQRRVGGAFGQEYRVDRQAVFRGKFKIARVMRGAAENCAGAVIHQDEIGDVDRQFPSRIKRMAHPDAGI